MYHRFNENKYPSTNIQLDVFKKQLEIIKNEKIKFISPKDFEASLSEKKGEIWIQSGEIIWPRIRPRRNL